MLRRTPCIGICSTTYGDLVCRGCKRFSHEIVGWNGYDREQRHAVWARLLTLRAGATRHLVEIVDLHVLTAASRPASGRAARAVGGPRGQAYEVTAVEFSQAEPSADPDPHLLAYELLQHLAGVDRPAGPLLGQFGLRIADAAFEGSVEDLLRLIDQECYERSLAHYERNFRTPAR
jgi:predicted Fe-S protein YdhL (DUF1289 family)